MLFRLVRISHLHSDIASLILARSLFLGMVVDGLGLLLDATVVVIVDLVQVLDGLHILGIGVYVLGIAVLHHHVAATVHRLYFSLLHDQDVPALVHRQVGVVPLVPRLLDDQRLHRGGVDQLLGALAAE